ncbi:MAG: MgtC/SapB family protein [Acholeplasmataceae bacterium]|jgi:putative Mg2+ transporter-C (MgtC) family protein|nr:MgtC/SapB family protein [Acholeplasmataceae bacterium]
MYFYDFDLSFTDIMMKIGVPLIISFIVGGFVGLERQNVGKAAGLSSHILVAMASAGIAIMQRLMFEHQIYLASTGVSIDPEGQRVIAQVITGIGFIGAGVILKDSSQVIKGITTAATIWFTAMTGLILGSGYLLIGSILGVFIIIFILARDFSRGFNPLVSHEKRNPSKSVEE